MSKGKKKKKGLIMSLSCPYKQMLAFWLCFSHSANHSYNFTDHSSASKRKLFLFLWSHCMLPTLVTSCFVRHQISTSPFLFAPYSISCRTWKLFPQQLFHLLAMNFLPSWRRFFFKMSSSLINFNTKPRKKRTNTVLHRITYISLFNFSFAKERNPLLET